MKKIIIPLLLLILSVNNFAQGKANSTYDFSFMRKDKVWVMRAADHSVVVLGDGFDPCLSPDGKKVAFTVNDGDERRHIAIVNLASWERTNLNVQNQNYYGPVWSPDGTKIAFNIWTDSLWNIGLIDADNKNFRVISGGVKTTEEICLSSWTPDGNQVIIHDLDSLLFLNLNGEITTRYDVHALTGDLVLSSDRKFLLTPDGRYFIFDGDNEDEGYYSDGVPGAIYSCNLATKEIKRLSPVGYDCRYPILNSDGAILYEAVKFNGRTWNIYMTDITGKKPEVLIRDASMISCRLK
jgi:TolB protein